MVFLICLWEERNQANKEQVTLKKFIFYEKASDFNSFDCFEPDSC